MKNLLLFSALIFLFSTCSVLDRKEATPSFLSVSEFDVVIEHQFQGSASSKITEVKVSIDGSTIGLFELPAVIPILEEGVKEVTFSAIIKQDGISTARVPYPFYEAYTTSLDFTPLDTTYINPVTVYFEDLEFSVAEFTQSIELQESEFSEGQLVIVTDELAFDDMDSSIPLSSVIVEMDDDGDFFFAETEEGLDLPAGQPVFIELNYATNHPFKVGARAFVQGAEAKSDLVIILPTSETEQVWNKIYINLTNFVAANSGATEFEVFIEMNKSDQYPEPELYLDNLKVIY